MAVAHENLLAPRLALLLEPVKPETLSMKGAFGWRRVEHRIRNRTMIWSEARWERRPEHDTYGAFVQHLIVWYVLCGVERQELARTFAISERQIQSYIGGNAWRYYSRAMLEEMTRMGISRGAGHWHGQSRRPREIAGAAMTTLQAAVDLIGRDDAPADAVETVRRRAAILTVRWME